MVFKFATPNFSGTSEDNSRDDISDRGGTSEDNSRDDISDRGGSDNILVRLGCILPMQTVRNTNFRQNGGEILERRGVQIFPKAKLIKATDNYDSSNKLRDDDFGSVHRGGSDNILVRLGCILPRQRVRNTNFRQNGGEILERRGVQIFPEAKLIKATNNYDSSNKLRDDDFGSVHRGNIEGDDVVVVGKPKDAHMSQIGKPKDAHMSQIKENFQREVEFLMKRSHENVVKLKGICLETRIPFLVYEYIPNGTLFEHIHQDESTILKSWGDRFRIAAEAARALNYMHSSIKPPIVHGNIKSANILLDQSYSAKVSDVGTSVLISPEHRYIVDIQKQDSLGYIDPEYLITRILTTESDVYSFGVILVELLTGKELFDTESGESINMIHRFISSMKGNVLSDVIDLQGASDDEMKRVEMVAQIAVECLDQRRVNRPAMREVACRLAVIHRGSAVEEVEEDIEEIRDAEKPFSR